MGNCFALCRPNWNSSDRVATTGHHRINVLRVVKTDGKILEYRASILVKDLLVNFSGYGVSLSKEASQHLTPNYELKIGQLCYLLPSPGSVNPTGISSDCTSVRIKRIKVIITKQQLQELLSKKASVEEMLTGLRKGIWDGVDSSPSWRPKLKTILEESE
ncbi:hypothetical protein HHK36_000016 [Tetracentron sinense]|uniref:Uncharacterized protein n=1 Tax=Tetracentron sinense TaxID=13715 RepID=A0A835DPM2_TETSI|nr:hypothetical protein HHK36_000016 [Tetracentron sinense]